MRLSINQYAQQYKNNKKTKISYCSILSHNKYGASIGLAPRKPNK